MLTNYKIYILLLFIYYNYLNKNNKNNINNTHFTFACFMHISQTFIIFSLHYILIIFILVVNYVALVFTKQLTYDHHKGKKLEKVNQQ